MTAKKILMIVGDYVEDYEAMMPFQALPMVSHIDKGTAGVVVDSNMVTGATFLSHSEWLAEFLKLLGTKISL